MTTFSLRIVDTVDSTNTELLRLPLSQAPPGTALLALEQTGGRGRSERVWESPLGGMYLSAALLPRWPQGLSLLGAKALLRLVESFGLRGKLRWPNDVTLEGRKIGGVLPVARYQGNALERAILGVGLNVCQPLQAFPAELRPSLTTLALACPGTDWDVPKVARAYLRALEVEMADLEQHGLARLSRACEPYLEGLGDGRLPVLVTPDQRHQSLPPVAGLSPTGALLLEGGEVLDTLGRDQRLRFSDEP